MDLKQNVSLCLEVLMLAVYGQNPLQDPKNKQFKVFMDMVDFLRPRSVLMENVVDLLEISNGFLGKYALSRLVGMNYQARLGMTGCWSMWTPTISHACLHVGCPSRREIATLSIANT